MLDFSKPADRHEYLILNGEPAKADETYMQIYSEAKKKIFIVDNYINIKTLRLLKGAKDGVDVTVFSDNLSNMLHAGDDQDFQRELVHLKCMIHFIGIEMIEKMRRKSSPVTEQSCNRAAFFGHRYLSHSHIFCRVAPYKKHYKLCILTPSSQISILLINNPQAKFPISSGS